MAAGQGLIRFNLRHTKKPHTMSKALETFESSIKDAEELLILYKERPKTSAESWEVLKRAGLVMAMTAWETYVEDRVREEVQKRLKVLNGSHAGEFMLARLEEELKRFHNPSSDKTRKLFLDYLKVDVALEWKWAPYEPQKVKSMLDEWISKRGDAVHRSRPPSGGESPAPHPVKKDDLEKAIRFIKNLVAATDRALS